MNSVTQDTPASSFDESNKPSVTEKERKQLLRSQGAVSATTVNDDFDRSFRKNSWINFGHSNMIDLEWPSLFAPKGISISRTITTLPQESYLNAEVTGDFCAKTDKYGSNGCKFKWGDAVEGKIVFAQGIDLTEDHLVQGTFTIDRLIHWDFSCAVCGKPCTVQVPVIKKEYTFKTTSCPFRLTKGGDSDRKSRVSIPVEHKFPETSPADGVKVHFKGKLKLVSQKNSRDILAEADIDFIMK